MKCPHCKKALQVPDNAIRNMESYLKACMTVTLCCGRGVRLYPKMSFEVIADTSGRKEDDWGRSVKQ